jgi:hypothetical protein
VRKPTVAALLVFAVLSLALTYPLPLHLANAVEDRQDALLNVWITAWDGHQLEADPLHLFDANIFYPYSRTLAYSELLLGNALLALPLTAASHNPVLGYNVALLLSFFLSGLGTYLLVLRLTRSPGAGLVAGTILAFCSYRMTNLAQAQLLTTQWLPFALLAWYQLLHRPRPRHVATFVLFFCLQALSSFYYGVLLTLTIFGFSILAFALSIGSPTQHHPSRLAFCVSRFTPLLLAACCSVLIILPFSLPYFQVQHQLGFERSLSDSEPFSASLRQYLMVPPGSVLHGRWLPSDDTPLAGGYPADALFPGLVALALGLWGIVRGRGRARWAFLLLLLAACALSFGPRLYLAPGQPAGLDLTLPYAWLYAIVPGFKALRAPGRFDALVMLALAVLAGYGIASFRPQSAGSRQKYRLFVACSLALVVAESLVWPAAHAEPVAVGSKVPAVYYWLAEQAQGASGDTSSVVLELPLAFTPGGPQLEYQYLSTYHWHTTPDGYSGFIPPPHGQIVYEMERFPSERSVSLLQALDVRYVVIHTDRYPAERWAEMQAALAQIEDLALVKTFGADQVFRLQARTFSPDVLVVYAYLPPRAVAGQPYTAYIIAINNGSRSYAVKPTATMAPTITWVAGKEQAVTSGETDMPLVTSPDGGAAVVPLALMAPTTSGTWRLAIAQPDGPEGEPLGNWVLAGSVEVGDQGDDAFPVPARLAEWGVPSTAQPGGRLQVNLTWQALGKIDAYYSVYVKLLDAEGHAVTGWDGQPRDGAAPTLLWVPGEAIDDAVTLTVPASTLAGAYTVEVGMYRAADLARCLTLNAEGALLDRVVLGTVQVGP